MGRFTIGNIGAKRYFTLFMPPDKLLVRMVESVHKVNNTIRLELEQKDNEAVVTLRGPDIEDVTVEFWRGMCQGVFDLTKTNGQLQVDDSAAKTDNKVLYKLNW